MHFSKKIVIQLFTDMELQMCTINDTKGEFAECVSVVEYTRKYFLKSTIQLHLTLYGLMN